jgi:regulator of sigma E protease
MVNIIYGFIALSLLILVHELGHFIVARIFNVKVLTFSIGFGKKILKKTKGETEYALSLVPLGGYVKLLGESPDEIVSEEEIHRSYAHKHPFVKILIAFTGPLFNILFASVLFYAVFVSGYSVLSTKVGSVEKGYPAYEAGIKEGDVIVRVEDKEIHEWGDLMEAMAEAPDKPLAFTIKRRDTLINTTITPKEIEGKNIFGETIKRKVIGIGASNEFIIRNENVFSAATKAFYQTYYLSKITVIGIVKLVIGSISPKNIGGPILILEMAGKQAKEGKKNLAYFIALISINLGIINLFPIPILDGGHILFHTIELITRRRLSQRAVDIAQKIGMGILVAVMILAFFNDIMRMFYGK